ncbi:MAG: sulfite exporter TauE/SafE family protein [Armatimonadetes bacterium]|nr:sulfite exporter TauE/SafE family protein [Armatimonadota bacterium]
MEGNLVNFIIVGFIAQVIDGALGMAYGVSSTTFLLSIGIAPAPASASVHTAEIFTSAVSGLSHLRFGNVDRRLFKTLLIPGVVGGALGAYILTAMPGSAIKPFVGIYLLVMGVMILGKALKKHKETGAKTRLVPLALAGGFLDAVGGGGWGPIVTSTLVARGHNPRLSIGSVNLAEFFVTVVQAVTFFAILGLANWRIILGLVIGGVLAAPLAARVTRTLTPRTLMILVGGLVMALSIRTIYLALL